MLHLRLLPTVLCALSLTGCLTQTPPFQAPRTEEQAEAAAVNTPWIDPTLVSLENDPALPGIDVKAAGNTDIVNFKQVNERLYRGGLPSEANLTALKKMGIKTDVDLMGEVPVYDTVYVAREKHWAKEAGLQFIQVKVPTGKVPFQPPISNAIAEQFLKVVLDPANQPCFIHCLHGRDRTGTMIAVYRMTQNGYTNQQALDEMKTFGFNPDHYPALAAFVANYHR